MIGFQLGHTNTLQTTLAAPPDTVNSSEQFESGTCETSRFSSSPLVVVDGVSKPWRIYDGQLEFDAFLLYVYSVFDDLHGLVNAL